MLDKFFFMVYNLHVKSKRATAQRRFQKMKYEVIMRNTTKFSNKEYAFKSKKECMAFLEEVLNAGCYESIISITKYNKHSFKSAWDDFFC